MWSALFLGQQLGHNLNKPRGQHDKTRVIDDATAFHEIPAVFFEPRWTQVALQQFLLAGRQRLRRHSRILSGRLLGAPVVSAGRRTDNSLKADRSWSFWVLYSLFSATTWRNIARTAGSGKDSTAISSCERPWSCCARPP